MTKCVTQNDLKCDLNLSGVHATGNSIRLSSEAGLLKLTANVDLQFAEVSHLITLRKLHDQVPVRWEAACALQRDRGTGSHGVRVLSTDGVVPQCWRRLDRGDIVKPMTKLSDLDSQQQKKQALTVNKR